MPSEVTEKFIRFLKTVRRQSKISTRELGQVVGKSAMFVSYLENGKIKTIDFDTAFDMLEAINKKQPFLSGEVNGDSSPNALISSMLIETFHIEPEEWVTQRLEEEKQRQLEYDATIKEVKNKTVLLSSLLDPKDSPNSLELLNTMVKMASMNVDLMRSPEVLECLNDFLSGIESRKRRLILIFFDTLFPADIGHKYLPHRTESEVQFVRELQVLLKKYD